MSSPMLSCFFLADQMIRDAISAKWGAIGLHCGYAGVPGFPFFMREIWFFLRVADAPDKIHLEAVVTAPSGVVVRTRDWHMDRAELAEAGPMATWWEVGGRIPEVMFPVAGRYSVEISINKHLLGEIPLYVTGALPV